MIRMDKEASPLFKAQFGFNYMFYDVIFVDPVPDSRHAVGSCWARRILVYLCNERIHRKIDEGRGGMDLLH